MSQEFFNPVRSVYGAGALSSLPKLLAGRKAVVVTFPEARRFGLVYRLQALLGDGLAGVIDAVLPNPDVAELRALYEAFWSDAQQAEVLVAVGGGSAIDTAKALMVGTQSGRFDDLVAALAAGKPFVPARVKTLIAVPTTAGTGSEVTPWATIWDREAQRKHSLHLPETWPSIAIVDPELMLSLPASVTLQSGLDALSHALESIWNVNANALSDTFAVAAVQQIFETLPLLMEKLDDLELRARMALAALQAGMAFSNTRTALAHSISYEMTLRYGLPHGIACSFPLPMVLRRAIGQDAGRDAVLERALGPLDRAPQRLSDFIERLGVKTHFSDYGVSSEQADRMVAHALTGARGKNFIGTPQKEAA
ncbi:iron-containing alcohol dehydrogenase PsrA [Variovorax sp.]|jgi:phosphonate metabolism-associated iron-containing alcohol dehydrogenase|uniref:iron-containing alcohol dehydrogenase PsrA n=1 Tax=Variovorax sp. TaxID=1871043 RepID=UPI0012027C9B|nr:iron-containing alcohol dehydrogenase PsrA [Variovorax sp.]TAJ64606.1 MAG: iron-containing alcohol dehydrogenase [Variovorax sp.]